MRNSVFFCWVFLLPLLAFGQEDGMKQLLSKYDAYHEQLPREKVYVQTDKPYYMAGDTIHYKAYLFQDGYAKPSSLSGVLYVELDNAAGKMVRQQMLPVVNGLTWADMPLDLKDIPQGSYVLRAFTNLMRNFGPADIFKKLLYVSSGNNNSTLIKADFGLTKGITGDQLKANLRFAGLDHRPLSLKDIQLNVVNGNRTLFKSKTTTGIDGALPLSFSVPSGQSLKFLEINARLTGKNDDTTLMTIPVQLNRDEDIDLQFMAEGGNLIDGFKSRVGFKAIGNDGRGKLIKGEIYDSKGVEQARFVSGDKGMGSFEFTPKLSEHYFAKINGQNRSYALPAVNNWGAMLHIDSQTADSIKINMQLKPDAQMAPVHGLYYLIGESAGGVRYAVPFVFRKEVLHISVPASVFPTGVARLSLLNYNYQPLAERLLFVDHGKNLHISITPNKTKYATRDSVALTLLVTDEHGKPVRGAFSLAVTDNGQVRTDSVADNMRTSLLLTADLKGTVEDPGYYFKENSIERKLALDNLLLTQGWVGYNWKDVLADKPVDIRYIAEPEFTLTGRAENAAEKGIEGVKLNLMSPKPLFVADATTDKKGNFLFRGGLFPNDSTAYVVQGKRKGGGSNIGIHINRLEPLANDPIEWKMMPWYVNSDTLLLKNIASNIIQQSTESKIKFGGKVLKDVTIKEVKKIKGSHNLNNDGADLTFDEESIQKEKKQSLKQYLLSHFKGFRVTQRGSYEWYTYDGFLVLLYVNGGAVVQFHMPQSLYMDNLMTDEIKGIEIMKSSYYSNPYITDFFINHGEKPPMELIVFIEVTTFSGHGVYIDKSPNISIYHPLPFTLPKDFYRPKYTIANVNAHPGTDLRPTIHWEPNIVTDKDGKATVTFFTSDRSVNYTVVIEGSDMQGHIGSVTQKLAGNGPPKTP